MTEQEHIDQETDVCEEIYDEVKRHVAAAADATGMCELSMIHCIWSAMLVDMIQEGWDLEDIINETMMHYGYAKLNRQPLDEDDEEGA